MSGTLTIKRAPSPIVVIAACVLTHCACSGAASIVYRTQQRPTHTHTRTYTPQHTTPRNEDWTTHALPHGNAGAIAVPQHCFLPVARHTGDRLLPATCPLSGSVVYSSGSAVSAAPTTRHQQHLRRSFSRVIYFHACSKQITTYSTSSRCHPPSFHESIAVNYTTNHS